MKHITPLLLLISLAQPFPLQAEDNRELHRARMELRAQFKKGEITKKEFMEQLRELEKKKSSSNSGDPSEPSDTSSSTDVGGDMTDIDSIEAEWRKKLENDGLTDSDVKDRLKDEMKIQKKLIKLEGRERDSESNELHMKEAKKIIGKLKILNDYPDHYLDSLVEDWEKWFWKSDIGRTNWLSDERDALEQDEINQRKKKAHSIRTKCHIELKAYWTDKGLHQKHKAAMHFSSAWSQLIGVTTREYKKARSESKLSLKRNGFDPKATGIFFEWMDALFEADD